MPYFVVKEETSSRFKMAAHQGQDGEFGQFDDDSIRRVSYMTLMTTQVTPLNRLRFIRVGIAAITRYVRVFRAN